MAFITIQSIHCYSYRLPLAQPFTIRHTQIDAREGLIINIISDHGDMGFGEIAPLPGVSVESLGKAEHQAEALMHAFKGAMVPTEMPVLLSWLSDRMPEKTVCPSVKLGFEAAIIGMAAQWQGQHIAAFLGFMDKEVYSAGLLQGPLPNILKQARFLQAKGYQTFKLNVGSRNIPADVQKVHELRSLLGPDAQIRLDADRRWRLDEAVVFCQHVGKDRIAYIEEPVMAPGQIETFFRQTDMPVALDETMDGYMHDFSPPCGAAYAIARPMLLGGITGYLRFLDAASTLGLKVIVAAGFESGIGITVLANLAAMTPCVANLGSANWFNDDLLLRPVVLDAGRVSSDRLDLHSRFFHPALTRAFQAV